MTPGTLVLLNAPKETSAAWGGLPAALRSSGLDVLAPDVPDETGPRYIACASLLVGASAPAPPLVLVARGAAGPLLPGVALAQRAAHRPIGGYVFVDADLPRPLRHDHTAPENDVPMPPDWPEAPCGYLRTHPDRETHDKALREAHLRGWPTTEQEPTTTIAQALRELIGSL
ncbi:hypothetical protein [Actinomadura decatromicini]|uniref:Alpha/beta hydrolase n=1 Tax=Actinomadura decatromicini TaxID=2604572 RepID=A0A5D3FQA5_9ACTN|nr:hypothetical protein [Actinomadura decatromicini]TYK50399.1 hypothetical protein FXF68_07640 [Actinomadura decatromicini]